MKFCVISFLSFSSIARDFEVLAQLVNAYVGGRIRTVPSKTGAAGADAA